MGTGEGVNALARVQGTRLRACQHTLHRVRGEMALGGGAQCVAPLAQVVVETDETLKTHALVAVVSF